MSGVQQLITIELIKEFIAQLYENNGTRRLRNHNNL